MDVSIIIVNYNTCELTRNCLKSIFEQTKDIDFEVIVADNDSHDGSVEMIKEEFPQVILIETGANLGFGRANNRGLAIAKGKYVFYLNSDTILLNNAVKIFFDYFENDKTGEIGALGCNLVDGDNKLTKSWGWIWTSKAICLIILTYKIKNLRSTKNKSKVESNPDGYKFGEVPYVTGADLFVKNNELAKFDEDFFMYSEEVNMQLQMHKVGLKSYLIDGPKIIHLDGGSTKGNTMNIKRKANLYLSDYILQKKNQDYIKENIGGGGILDWPLETLNYLDLPLSKEYKNHNTLHTETFQEILNRA